jgi:hypothetical protein
MTCCSRQPAWRPRATGTQTISSTEDRAHIHKRLKDGMWAALYDRNADAQAPAGGASASLNDMLRFLRLQLGGGTLEGKEIVDEDAVAQTQVPQVIPGPPPSAAARAGFYGFGWNVSYDDEGRARIGHSGAFELGTATNITFMPSEDIGIVVLTNGQPIGVAEAIGAAFFDVAQNDKQTVDWVGFMGGIFEKMRAADAPAGDYTATPGNPKPVRDLAAYVGSYGNSYYGPLVVSAADGGLSMTIGPQATPINFTLTHFDGDTFSFKTVGENANGLAGAIFTIGEDGLEGRPRLLRPDRAWHLRPGAVRHSADPLKSALMGWAGCAPYSRVWSSRSETGFERGDCGGAPNDRARFR